MSVGENTQPAAPTIPRWDHGLFKESVLSDYDQRCIPYAICEYLHNVTGIPHCNGGANICAMCGGAVRLVLQRAEPLIIDAVVKKMARVVGRGDVDLHPIHRGDY